MNARIRKEARTLLPAMVVTLLSVAVPLIISGHKAARFGCFPLVFGFVTIGAISFGNEFQHRTIQMLLTQPIARTTVWLEKLMVLGTGIGIGLLIYLIGLLIFDADILYEADAPAAAVFIILSSLCAFCSTPYWTLIARNSLAGVVFSLVVPIFVLVGYELLDEHFAFGPRAELILTVAIGAAYSLFFHRLGYSRFKKLQVLDGGHQELGMPAPLEAAIGRPLKALFSRFRGPFASLVKKEFRLQQLSFIGAFLLCALVAVAVASIRQRHTDAFTGTLFTILVIYIGAIPLIVGAASVAEEKSWGIADWHMTLPPSGLKQWAVKMLVALSTSLSLGLLLPLALIWITGLPIGSKESSSLPWEAFAMVVPLQMLVTSLAIYGGCLSSNTLRGVLVAIGMAMAGSFSFSIAGGLVTIFEALGFQMGYAYQNALSSRTSSAGLNTGLPLFEIAALLGLSVMIQWFSFQCFRKRGMGKGAVVIQVLLWIVAICSLIVALSIIFINPFR